MLDLKESIETVKRSLTVVGIFRELLLPTITFVSLKSTSLGFGTKVMVDEKQGVDIKNIERKTGIRE
ncbi:MAG: hypothetical protein JETT_1248 [Candidatus Jettenia ecosi]|uniref:Uncharacterized protein n=1 Tax=Candidatus Jettenia ecosi TaxID=2494326 RepID=A0A533QCF6_9BACT|nr:MAG: hypothetical protein JETT_1248 [Candidatus Jettenia ecosi]